MSDERIATLLQGLADKLGVTAAYLWGVLVAQARIDFYASLLQYVLIVVGCFATYRFVRWWRVERAAEEWVFLIVPAIILCAVFVIVGFCHLPTFIASIANPEYWALREILNAVKPK